MFSVYFNSLQLFPRLRSLVGQRPGDLVLQPGAGSLWLRLQEQGAYGSESAVL